MDQITVLLLAALACLAVGLGALWLQERRKRARAEAAQVTLELAKSELERLAATERSGYQSRLLELSQELQYLARFRDVADAEQLKKDLEREVELIQQQAKEQVADARQRSESIMSGAQLQANQIIEHARTEARRVAGDALAAVEDARRLEQTVRAMKNIIEGYGDEYLIPTHQLLDELSEEYAHDEAGEQLKLARKHTKFLVESGQAAACDYVDRAKHATAVRFVLDAFNGQVDAVLSKLKGKNPGVVEQKIRDAFAIVNHHGAAFRRARIADSFLAARLKEAQWGLTVHLLRERDREEQRRIKAQIREEERAQKEFEKAVRDAEKEEGSIRKAIEKAQAKLAKAHQAEREKLEGLLGELAAKLAEAEAKMQRATSMAQLTRSGHVYVISNIGSFGEHVYKIGMTRRLEPMDRVRELGDASVPFHFDVHAMIYSEDAPALETALHRRFAIAQVNKVNPRREFFAAQLTEIRACIEQLGLRVHWTMKAEAAEYRETMALDAAMEKNPAVREEWLEGQAKWDAYVDALMSEDSVEIPSTGPSSQLH